jgi:hypothetical protein
MVASTAAPTRSLIGMPESRTPLADKRLAELKRQADDARRRRHPGEISYRMSIVGWEFIKAFHVEQFVGWLGRKLNRGHS